MINLIPILLKLYTCCDHAFEDMHISFKVDIFLMKINILVTDFINDVTYSRKSVNTHVVIYTVCVFSRDVNECRNRYSNIRIGHSNIFEYSNDIHIYVQ